MYLTSIKAYLPKKQYLLKTKSCKRNSKFLASVYHSSIINSIQQKGPHSLFMNAFSRALNNVFIQIPF